MTLVRRVSGSEFKAFRRCKRSWWLGYLRGLTWPEREPGALELGSLTHVGMEVMHEPDHSVAKAKIAIIDKMQELAGDDPELYVEMAADAMNYIDGYEEWLATSGADQRYEHVASEEEFEMPLVKIDDTQWVLIGKLDRRVRDRANGQVRFIDYKTCANFEDLILDAHRNEQFPTYEMLLRYNNPGLTVGGGIWRMIRKVKRARDGDGDFFRDYESTYNDHVLASIMRRYQAMAMDMHEMASQLEGETGDRVVHQSVAPPNPTHTCKWDCSFRLVCDMFDDGSRVEAAVSSLYIQSDPYARYRILGRESE